MTHTGTVHTACSERVKEAAAPRKSEPRGHRCLFSLGLSSVAWS